MASNSGAPSLAKAVETLIVLQRTKKRCMELSERRKEDQSELSVRQKPMTPKIVDNPIETYNFVYSEAVEQAACNYRYDRGQPCVTSVAIHNAKPICRNLIRRWAKAKKNKVEEQESGSRRSQKSHGDFHRPTSALNSSRIFSRCLMWTPWILTIPVGWIS